MVICSDDYPKVLFIQQSRADLKLPKKYVQKMLIKIVTHDLRHNILSMLPGSSIIFVRCISR
ncbi:hypothetical protein [Candidatus Symbiopectobacterium sp.]|uniref:hypothetical protein n=1 Tax=Candidatus Symbiopectobacterium sp. TaxID=2816440 RepID=UPI0025BACE60|nr:hypothetical protein [Candidatus Symbiopectobacterium sp.]